MLRRARDLVAEQGRALGAAMGFLTILPVTSKGIPTATTGGAVAASDQAPGVSEGYLVPALPMFPVAGALIGALAGAVFVIGQGMGLPPLAGALLAVATLVVVTGALHEDGLGDVADGFGGGRSVADKLRIMRDSRVGTFGVIAIVLSVGLRAGALSGLPPFAGCLALVAAASLSRGVLSLLLYRLSPARSEGLATAAGAPRASQVRVAMAVAGLIALVTLDLGSALTAAAVATAGVILVGILAERQVGGHTGDVCGAAQQVAEVAALLAIAASQ